MEGLTHPVLFQADLQHGVLSVTIVRPRGPSDNVSVDITRAVIASCNEASNKTTLV